MTANTSGLEPDCACAPQACGQKTTVFVTAAERQSTLRRRASPYWLLPLVFGCAAGVRSTLVHSPPRPLVPRSVGSVQVLQSPPAEPYVEVALLQVEQSEQLEGAEQARLIARLREEAAKIGCDALYVPGSFERKGASTRDAESDPLLARCIVFTPPDATLETAHTRESEPAAR
jgi:hypothetical protein